MAYVRVALVENRTGTSVVFSITKIDGQPYGMRIRFRELGTLPWSASSMLIQPSVGDTIEIDGLTDGLFYEFFPVAVAEDGSEELPGNIIRARVTAADTITQLRDAIASTLSYFLPAQNIRYGASAHPAPHDKDYPIASIAYLGQAVERPLNCCGFTVHRFRVTLRQEGLSDPVRQEMLNRHLEEMVRYFGGDLSPFSAVEGYYDTRVTGVKTAADSGKDTAVSVAGFTLECVVKS